MFHTGAQIPSEPPRLPRGLRHGARRPQARGGRVDRVEGWEEGREEEGRGEEEALIGPDLRGSLHLR